MAADEPDARKRITGIRWLVDQTFIDNLTALLDEPGVTSESIARELSKVMRQEVDDSGVRALKAKLGKGSVLVGPLAKLKGWPVPPLADAEDEFGIDAAGLYELEGDDPAGIAAIREAIRDRVQSLRKMRKLRRTESGS